MKKLLINALLFPSFLFCQTLSPIVSGEYFVDSDPGFGSATSFTVTSATTASLQNFSAAVPANLQTGEIHFLYFRFKNADNTWGIPMRRSFYVKGNYGNLSPIVAGEYFVDSDPGVGQANALSITAGETVNLAPVDITIQNLDFGIHHLYIRFKNALGNWGIPMRRSFYKPNYESLSPIVEAEYFIDVDPGIGTASLVAIQSGYIVEQQVDLSYSNLTEGDHILYLRVKNAEGMWSFIKKEIFTVSALSVPENTAELLKIYPNPFVDYLHVESENAQISKMEIFDFSGKKAIEYNQSSATTDLQFLSDGVYLLKITKNDHITLTKKIIKKAK